jgi:hypothetical protein
MSEISKILIARRGDDMREAHAGDLAAEVTRA